jgi:hypothetical protein
VWKVIFEWSFFSELISYIHSLYWFDIAAMDPTKPILGKWLLTQIFTPTPATATAIKVITTTVTLSQPIGMRKPPAQALNTIVLHRRKRFLIVISRYA